MWKVMQSKVNAAWADINVLCECSYTFYRSLSIRIFGVRESWNGATQTWFVFSKSLHPGDPLSNHSRHREPNGIPWNGTGPGRTRIGAMEPELLNYLVESIKNNCWSSTKKKTNERGCNNHSGCQKRLVIKWSNTIRFTVKSTSCYCAPLNHCLL